MIGAMIGAMIGTSVLMCRCAQLAPWQMPGTTLRSSSSVGLFH
jgi:hypothetical protein